MKVTYYGHSCFLLDINGSKVLFDPFISPNELAKDINISDIKPDYILITHGHEDHVADVEVIAKQSDAKLVSSFEIISWFGHKGLNNGHPMNIGGSVKLDFGTVKYVTAIHSSVMPDGAYGGNPGGFVIQTKDKTIYYAGDTALTYDMKLLAEEFDIDLAFLPIGDNFTMGAHDAAKAAGFVNCKEIIGMHYDTFPYIEIDKVEAKIIFKKEHANLSLLAIGETKEY